MSASRAAVVTVFAVAALLDASIARADGGAVPVKSQGTVAVAKNQPPETDELDPAWAFGVAGTLGVDAISERGPFDRELTSFGRAPVPVVAVEMGGRFSAFVHGLELSVAPSAVLTPEPRDRGQTYYRAFRFFGDLSYDLWRAQVFTIGPSLGVGWMHSDVCFPGDPASASSTDGPLFHQVVANPGAGACLATSSWIVRTGAVVGFMVPTPMRLGSATMYTNARPMFEWPFVAKDSPYALGPTYTREGSSLPPFEGPTAPHPSFTFMLELGFLYGAGAR